MCVIGLLSTGAQIAAKVCGRRLRTPFFILKLVEAVEYTAARVVAARLCDVDNSRYLVLTAVARDPNTRARAQGALAARGEEAVR